MDPSIESALIAGAVSLVILGGTVALWIKGPLLCHWPNAPGRPGTGRIPQEARHGPARHDFARLRRSGHFRLLGPGVASDQDGPVVPAALAARALPTVRGGYRYAEIPVSAWPRARVWISSVPS